jgi:hypothetical protein
MMVSRRTGVTELTMAATRSSTRAAACSGRGSGGAGDFAGFPDVGVAGQDVGEGEGEAVAEFLGVAHVGLGGGR